MSSVTRGLNSQIAETRRLARATAQRWAGLAFLILGVQFMTVMMLASSVVPGYDFQSAAISDLGIAPATATMFNVSLLLVGVLNLVGGTMFFETHRKRALLAVFAIAGVGAIGAAVLPLDTGAPHSLSALVAFVFFNLECVTTGFVVTGPMRWLSVTAGIVGLGFVGVMLVGDSGNPSIFGAIGHGGVERMIVYPAMVLLIALGGYLVGAADDRWNGRSTPVSSR